MNAKAAKTQDRDRRTTGVQRQGRAAKVISSVLQATGEELNRVGYANLRIDEVAERAGVNKTTIYRRWPTKAELVCDTISADFRLERPQFDTGSLRGDFLEYLKKLIASANGSMWRGIHTTLTGRSEPEIEALAQELHLKERDFRTSLVERAIDRGELPRSVNPELIGDLISAPILRRLLTFGEEVAEGYAEAVVDVVLAGAVVVALREPGAS